MSAEALIQQLREADTDSAPDLLDQADEMIDQLAKRIDLNSETSEAIYKNKSYTEIANASLSDMRKWPDSVWEIAQIASLANAARGAVARLLPLLPADSPTVIKIMNRRRRS